MGSLEGRAVLVVDDDADTLELYASALEKLGANVQRAKSAEVAMALLLAWRADVVLCDLHLPDFDGYSVLDFVKNDSALCNMPVIAISGSHPTVERARALEMGFVRYFTKPTKLRDIADSLIAVIEARRAPSST
jgi:CheY-like chemotaxis protein